MSDDAFRRFQDRMDDNFTVLGSYRGRTFDVLEAARVARVAGPECLSIGHPLTQLSACGLIVGNVTFGRPSAVVAPLPDDPRAADRIDLSQVYHLPANAPMSPELQALRNGVHNLVRAENALADAEKTNQSALVPLPVGHLRTAAERAWGELGNQAQTSGRELVAQEISALQAALQAAGQVAQGRGAGNSLPTAPAQEGQAVEPRSVGTDGNNGSRVLGN